MANWPDVIGRERVVANYGTNGGAVLNRPEVAPERSETLLVTTTLYKDTGESNRVIDPMGHETRWDNDNAGRRVRVIKNYVPGCPEQSQTSEYAWHASGQLERLTLLNEVTGNQVTRWIYGTTLADSDLASNNLLRAKIYPESDDRPAPLNAGPDGIYARLQYGYNRQAQSTTFTDADGTVHEYVYDKLGRLLDDQITTLAAHLDGAVRCIGNGYDLRGLPAKVTSYDAASGGSVVNEVEFVYDAFGNLKEDWQSHSGAVNGSTPKVGYTRTNGANNTLRLTRLTYPNGETVDPHYGPMHQASSHFNRVEALKAPGDFGDMVEYTYAGVGWQVEAIYNGQFGDEICRLTYKKLAGEPLEMPETSIMATTGLIGPSTFAGAKMMRMLNVSNTGSMPTRGAPGVAAICPSPGISTLVMTGWDR
ncbi:RHS repeat domain-containing protein [Verrucomicrobium spinosum]|uniref:RHS repeat domain-containing protein n=1 Tax=Verrucomicrobium spinosum TaxID=2736 RepID=UPI000946254B|nr:RHS repeat domain-containing protein [Verrucomicrobium spinosum]